MFAAKHPKRRARRLHNPERTRQRLLQAAYREVYRSGFRSASLDAILGDTGVTKGALYYHFDGKEALGHAIVEEVVAVLTRDKWVLPLGSGGDPIETLINIVRGTSLRPEEVRGGCPFNNLAQEMSPLDEKFRKRLARVFRAWRQGIAAALRRGQTQGTVRRHLDPDKTSSFLIAMYEGSVSLAKNAQDVNVLKIGIRNIAGWLTSLRAPATAQTR